MLIAHVWRLFVAWLTFTLLATALLAAAVSLVELGRRAIAWCQRWPGVAPRGLEAWFRARRHALTAGVARYGADVDQWARLSGCPACLRMIELTVQYPHLTPAQLDAIVRRQIALGHCGAHRYDDAVTE